MKKQNAREREMSVIPLAFIEEKEPAWRKRSIFSLTRSVQLSMIGIFLLASCGEVKLHWSEEVLLSSGKTVVVKRNAHGEKLGEIGGPGGWEQKEMSVEIEGGTSGVFTPPVWRTAFVPVLLDYDAGHDEWLIVATFYTCQGWYELGRPALPYVEYRVSQGEPWRIVPLEADLIGRKTNMLSGISSGGEPALLTLADKAGRDRRAGEEYRNIVGKWLSSC